jgi:hypothetical protein
MTPGDAWGNEARWTRQEHTVVIHSEMPIFFMDNEGKRHELIVQCPGGAGGFEPNRTIGRPAMGPRFPKPTGFYGLAVGD